MIQKISIKNILFLSLLAITILFGIILRTHFYFHYTNFWGDEVALLDNFEQKSFMQLFLPLYYSQCCPPVFAILGKLLYSSFGSNELAIRSLPYISSVLSVIAFAFLTFKIFKNKFAIIAANLLFCLAERIYCYIYFKQYQTDVLFTILLLLAALHLKDKTPSYFNMFLLSLLASFCVFCSYTSGFIIFCLLIILFFKNNYKDKKQNILHFLCFLIPFSIIMGVYFIINCLPIINNEYLQLYWGGKLDYSNEVFYPQNISQIKEYLSFFTGYWDVVFNYKIFVLVLFISIIALFIKNKFSFFILFMPFVLAYILGVAKLYPFVMERVSIYLTPIFIIIFCASLNYVYFKTKSNKEYLGGGAYKGTLLTNILSFIVLTLFIYSINWTHIYYNSQNTLSLIEINKRTNCKQFVELLLKSDITQNDYIYTDPGSWFMIEYYYDKNKKLEEKLKNRRIWHNENPAQSDLNLSKAGDNIYFYIHPDYYQNYESLEQWINDNCKIEYRIEGYYGDFIKCKKNKEYNPN